MKSMSKRQKENQSQFEGDKLYTPHDAFESIKRLTSCKFDETVEVHFNLGIDPRHADQQLRGTLSLPHGNGKTIRLAVITSEDKIKEAKDAGADIVGCEDLIEKIQKGWLEFDLLIATPDVMSKVGKLGRILGAKGLMPNPKSGTVTSQLTKSINEFKSGKVEYRNDKGGLVHLGIGKFSFTKEALVENFISIYEVICKDKPNKSKGIYLKSISVSTTMGPGFNIETQRAKWKED